MEMLGLENYISNSQISVHKYLGLRSKQHYYQLKFTQTAHDLIQRLFYASYFTFSWYGKYSEFLLK